MARRAALPPRTAPEPTTGQPAQDGTLLSPGPLPQRTMTFRVSGMPPGPNERLHWAARLRIVGPLALELAWQARAAASTLPGPLEHATVRMTLYRRKGQREQDADNATASLKPLIDALVTGGLLVDDSPAHIALEVVQAIASPLDMRWTKVEVTA